MWSEREGNQAASEAGAMSEGMNERLQQIRERAAKATDGPWRAGTTVSTGVHSVSPEWDWPTHRGGGRTIAGEINSIDNAEFIAHARSDIPWLLTQLAAILKENQRLINSGQKAFSEIVDLTAKLKAAEAKLERMQEALQVIAIALKEPAGGEYWSARKFLDKRNIYNDDLDGERVLLRVAEAALAE